MLCHPPRTLSGCRGHQPGGGLPYPYQPQGAVLDLQAFGHLLRQAQARFSRQTGRSIRLEIEPGRYMVAPAACLVTRVTDVKYTETNGKGRGHTFVMVVPPQIHVFWSIRRN